MELKFYVISSSVPGGQRKIALGLGYTAPRRIEKNWEGDWLLILEGCPPKKAQGWEAELKKMATHLEQSGRFLIVD